MDSMLNRSGGGLFEAADSGRRKSEKLRAIESPLNTPSNETLQAAARLKLVLGSEGRVVAVMGLTTVDGATMVVARLGAALARIDRSQVLVLDGNLRSPGLGDVFGVPRVPGLADILEGRSDLHQSTHGLDLDNLFVLPAGAGSIASLLSSPGCAMTMASLRDRFRYIVIDAGLAHAGPDALVWASLSDGVVAALAAGIRRRHEVVEFQQELERLKIPLLGVVLTQTARDKRKRRKQLQ